MPRIFIHSSSRVCIRCSSDLLSPSLKRSFNSKRKIKPQVSRLLDPASRAERIKAAGEAALQQKYDRNAYNKRYAEKRKEERKARAILHKEKEREKSIGLARRARGDVPKDALKAFKEDFALGPLAPRRDVGELEDSYGMLMAGLQSLPELTEREKGFARLRMGENEFVKGDRVVLLKGKNRGNIGTILSIDEQSMSATVEGVNQAAVSVPDFMIPETEEDRRPFRVQNTAIPLDHLRLVYSSRDPTTNKVKEVLLTRMDLVRVLNESPGKTAKIKADPSNKPLPTFYGEPLSREKITAYELEDYEWKTLRYLPNTLSLPESARAAREIPDLSGEDPDTAHEKEETHAVDTMRYTVDAVESPWIPEIGNMPVELSVLKELGAFKRKTTARYSDEIETAIRRRAEDQERAEMEREDRVRTPLQELKLEVKRWEREALRERKEALLRPSTPVPAPSTALPGSQKRETTEPQSSSSSSRLESQRKGNAAPAPPPEKQVSDIMVQIGLAMARNLAARGGAKSPRQGKILKKILDAQQGAVLALDKEGGGVRGAEEENGARSTL